MNKEIRWWQVVLATIVVSTLGALSTGLGKKNQQKLYERKLKQAPWAPPAKLFGPAWSVNNYFLLKALKHLLESDSIEGKRRVSHGGGIHGFVTNISRVPADDICIVLLSNIGDPAISEIAKSIFAILYGKEYELPKERVAIKLPEEKLKEYEGEYEINKDLHVVISLKDGELVAAPTGQKTDILYAEKEDFLFVKSQDIQLEFTRNDKKEIDGFILHQNGAKIPCKKIK